MTSSSHTSSDQLAGKDTAKRPQPTLQEILTVLRVQQPLLKSRYRVRSLGVFGSFLHGDATSRSDLDLLVEYDSPPTLLQFVRLQRELTELVGFPVDLVMKSALKTDIGKVILSEVKLI